MSNNEQEILKISSLLKPEYQAELLTWVHLAYAAEKSVRKSLGLNLISEEASSKKRQDNFC